MRVIDAETGKLVPWAFVSFWWSMIVGCALMWVGVGYLVAWLLGR